MINKNEIKEESQKLEIKGQTTIQIKPSLTTTTDKIRIELKMLRQPDSEDGLWFIVTEDEVIFYRIEEKIKTNLRFEVTDLGKIELSFGIDLKDPEEDFWVSLATVDSESSYFRFGKGEAREETTLLLYKFSENENNFVHGIQYWNAFGDINSKTVSKFPVRNHPVHIVETGDVTMDTVAKDEARTILQLKSAELAELHSIVSGPNFRLETDDFPDFPEAISWSCTFGWCCRKLNEKAGSGNRLATYLRVVMGSNLGDSPGSPYVLEIWPPGHYSSIHKHAGAYAITRVLTGEVTVSLYRSLSLRYTTPFLEKVIKDRDIVWISPTYNQTHKVSNRSDKICVTIQCYLYPQIDNNHHETFDYIDHSGKDTKHFKPKSDCEFLEFKEIIRSDWNKAKQKERTSQDLLKKMSFFYQ